MASLSFLSVILALTAASLGLTVSARLTAEKYTLSNGLEVILSEDHELPVVALNLWYHVGPVNEGPGESGLAHLFEHMMLQGSAHISKRDQEQILQTLGGVQDATTSFDRTYYYASAPASYLETLLWITSDRLGFLLPALSQEKLDNQIAVVLNERRVRLENTPYGPADLRLTELLYPSPHPYHGHIIGSPDDIRNATLQSVNQFFWNYGPDSTSLVIVGDFDREKVRTWIEKYFGSLPSSDVQLRPSGEIQRPPTRSLREAVVTSARLPRLSNAWVTAPAFSKDEPELELLASILAEEEFGPLKRKLVIERKLAESVSCNYRSRKLGSLFQCDVILKKGTDPGAAERELDRVFATVATTGPKESDVGRAKATWKSALLHQLEEVLDRADLLGRYNFFTHDPLYGRQEIQHYESVTSSSIRNAARRWLGKSQSAVVTAGPAAKVTTREASTKPSASSANRQDGTKLSPAQASDAQAWRSTRPVVAAGQQPVSPPVLDLKLNNGIPVYMVENHSVPLLVVRMTVLAGSGANPLVKPGLAYLTARSLAAGAGRLSSEELSNLATVNGTKLSMGSTPDSSFAMVDTPSSSKETALGILADVVLRPKFQLSAVDKVRQTVLTELLKQEESGVARAENVLRQTIYGSQHPYAFSDLGTEDSIRNITPKDIREFHKTYWRPDNAAIVVVGDIAPAEAIKRLNSLFGSWRAVGAMASFDSLPAVSLSERKIVLVDNPSAKLASVAIGHLGVKRSSPDWEAVDVMNRVLGGTYYSRINMNLRERRGYTYNTRSRFTESRGPGYFVERGGIQIDKVGAAVEEVLKEVERMRREPPAPDELQATKVSTAFELSWRLQSGRTTAEILGNLASFKLGANSLREYLKRLEQVKADDVALASRKYLFPDNIAIVIVGPADKFVEDLKSRNLGKVIRFGVDSNHEARAN